ncbi:MAG: sulfatase [Myxococcota bacterium]
MTDRLLQKRWPWALAVALVVMAFAASLFVSVDGDPRPRGSAEDIARLAERDDLNLLFVLIDTLRAHRMGSYGYARDTSPVLDALAARGIRFARHQAQSSWTKVSMASLWTSLYPVRHGVTRFEDVLADEAPMPAEILREAGFRTTAIFRNGWVAPHFGFAQGFEAYERPVVRGKGPEVRRENPTVLGGGTDMDAVTAAEEFLRIHGRERWFLYLHLMDVHEYLYDEDTAVFGTSYEGVYDNSILRENLVIDQLMTQLRDGGHLEDTVIVFVSDHGEAFNERGIEGHARFVYRETTEVPFILSLPFRLDPGVVVNARTRNVDVWPTILDLLGLPALPQSDGRSRLPEMLAAARGEATSAPDPTGYAFLDRSWGQRVDNPAPTVSIVEGSLRYVWVGGPDGTTAQEQLFDASTDPDELVSVLAERPEDAERLRRLAQQHLASQPASWAVETPTLELDELELNQLRALGYQVP